MTLNGIIALTQRNFAEFRIFRDVLHNKMLSYRRETALQGAL